METRSKIKKVLKPFSRLPFQTKVILSVAAGLLILYGLLFAIPKPVAFAYSGEDCVQRLTLLPQLHKEVGDSGFQAQFTDTILWGNVSLKTCFAATKAPKVGQTTVSVSPFGNWIAAKKFLLNVKEKPTAKLADFVGKTLPVTRAIEINLSQQDEVYDYKLQIDDKIAPCEHKNKKLSCVIELLNLQQGENYKATLLRYFMNKKVDTIGGGDITTLKALKLVDASLSGGQVVYDKPTSFAFKYDKTIKRVVASLQIQNDEKYTDVPVETSSDDTTAIVTLSEQLKRNASYVLTLKSVEANDGSVLPESSAVNFTTSGGPKVTGISIGSTGVATGGSITVSFDQEIANDNKISELVSTKGLNAIVKKSGNNLVISYSGTPLCSAFTISVLKGFESNFGIAQDQDWTFNSRTLCYSIRTFGYSAKGRPMNAYTFGSGSKTILFTGAIHGNEQSARLLMNAWINELDANAQNIPEGVRIVVVPSVNPDGVAANTRANGNNVDLNRNFNTSDWKKDIVTPSNQPWPGGGGSAPESEPETKALVSFTRELAPYLTMSYHSVAAYVIANTCGNSAALASTYSKLSGYSNKTGVSGAFGYEITGTYDDWMCERYGWQSVLIELATSNSSEFSRNKAALWAMARS